MSLLLPICEDPTPFHGDPTICRLCGHTMADHKATAPTGVRAEYLAKLVAVFIEHGGVHEYHGGGISAHRTRQMREHMANCSVDLANTREPEMDWHYEFTTTFDPSDQVNYLTLHLHCTCGTYGFGGQDLILPEVNMSQLIWYVTRDTGA